MDILIVNFFFLICVEAVYWAHKEYKGGPRD